MKLMEIVTPFLAFFCGRSSLKMKFQVEPFQEAIFSKIVSKLGAVLRRP